jgi:transposase
MEMRQKFGHAESSSEGIVKDIRRATGKRHSAEEKIHMRREAIAESLYYGWSKEFLEAGKKRLACDTARAATSGEVKDLRSQAQELKAVVTEQAVVAQNSTGQRREAGDFHEPTFASRDI